MEYLNRDEFRGRVQLTNNNNSDRGVNDSMADESLLVSPILADYIGDASSSNRRTPRDDAMKKCSDGDNSTSPERINLGSDLQLDASCISLGLGSIESVETSLQREDLNVSLCGSDDKGPTEVLERGHLASPTSSKASSGEMSSMIGGGDVSPIPSKNTSYPTENDTEGQESRISLASHGEGVDEGDKSESNDEDNSSNTVDETKASDCIRNEVNHFDCNENSRLSTTDVDDDKKIVLSKTEGDDKDAALYMAVNNLVAADSKLEESLSNRDVSVLSAKNASTTSADEIENDGQEKDKRQKSVTLGERNITSSVMQIGRISKSSIAQCEGGQLLPHTPSRTKATEVLSEIGGGDMSPIPIRSSSSPTTGKEHHQLLSPTKEEKVFSSKVSGSQDCLTSIEEENNFIIAAGKMKENKSSEDDSKLLNDVERDTPNVIKKDFVYEDKSSYESFDNPSEVTTSVLVSIESSVKEQQLNEANVDKDVLNREPTIPSPLAKKDNIKSLKVSTNETKEKENPEPTIFTPPGKKYVKSPPMDSDKRHAIAECVADQLSSLAPLRSSVGDILSKIGGGDVSPIPNRNSSSPSESTRGQNHVNKTKEGDILSPKPSTRQDCDGVNTSEVSISSGRANNCGNAADSTSGNMSTEDGSDQMGRESFNCYINEEKGLETESGCKNENAVVFTSSDPPMKFAESTQFSGGRSIAEDETRNKSNVDKTVPDGDDESCNSSENSSTVPLASTISRGGENNEKQIFALHSGKNPTSPMSDYGSSNVDVEFDNQNNTTISDISVLDWSYRTSHRGRTSQESEDKEKGSCSSEQNVSFSSSGSILGTEQLAICSTSALANEPAKSPRNESVDAVCNEVDFSAETRSPVRTGHFKEGHLYIDTNAVTSPKNSSQAQTYRDLSSAKKKLGATSSALMERLRGAAEQRKLEVARSRESLAEREKKRLMIVQQISTPFSPKSNNASEGYLPASNLRTISHKPKKRDGVDPYKPFKARQLPMSTGEMGSGGQIGVPKVAKKHTTTPVSPKLGRHRPSEKYENCQDDKTTKLKVEKHIKQRGQKVPHLKKPVLASTRRSWSNRVNKEAKPEINTRNQFKALPLPMTNARECHGGQYGVPRVTKRPVTVPFSPPLGSKRNSVSKHKAINLSNNKNELTTKKVPLGDIPPPRHHKEKHPSSVRARSVERVALQSEASQAKEREIQNKLDQLEAEAQKLAAEKAKLLPLSAIEVPSTNVESPDLLGLELLNKRPRRTTSPNSDNKENYSVNLDSTFGESPKKKNRLVPYNLHSTARAKERAKFENGRSSREKMDRAEAKRIRQKLIQEKMAELDELRESLR